MPSNEEEEVHSFAFDWSNAAKWLVPLPVHESIGMDVYIACDPVSRQLNDVCTYVAKRKYW